jgi:hypothetical protein
LRAEAAKLYARAKSGPRLPSAGDDRLALILRAISLEAKAVDLERQSNNGQSNNGQSKKK